MKPKPKPKRITLVGTLNTLRAISGCAVMLNGEEFYFKLDQAETLRPLWGKRVQVILDVETNYLKQIERIEGDTDVN